MEGKGKARPYLKSWMVTMPVLVYLTIMLLVKLNSEHKQIDSSISRVYFDENHRMFEMKTKAKTMQLRFFPAEVFSFRHPYYIAKQEIPDQNKQSEPNFEGVSKNTL